MAIVAGYRKDTATIDWSEDSWTGSKKVGKPLHLLLLSALVEEGDSVSWFDLIIERLVESIENPRSLSHRSATFQIPPIMEF